MKFWYFYSFPIKFVLRFIIPNPLKIRKLYPLTFFMCIVSIGINAFMIVWMLTALGVVIHCPDIVMGLTFLAAGSATPEAVSSAISVRKGEFFEDNIVFIPKLTIKCFFFQVTVELECRIH